MRTRDEVKIELAMEVLQIAERVRFRAIGTSMLPTIWPGDILTVRRKSFREIQVGDVAVFQRAGRLVTHRVVGKTSDVIIAQGDAKRRADAPFGQEDLLGRVVAIHRSEKEAGMAERKTFTRRAMRAAFQSSHLIRQFAVHLNAAVLDSWK
jgi:signal peptidase I